MTSTVDRADTAHKREYGRLDNRVSKYNSFGSYRSIFRLIDDWGYDEQYGSCGYRTEKGTRMIRTSSNGV